VGSVGGDVGEEGVWSFCLFFDPSECGGEEEVGAVAFGFNKGAVMANGGVEVFVAGCISAGAWVGLPNAASAVYKGFVEAALVRLVGFLVSEVPFAENTALVIGFGQDLRKDGGVESHAFTLKNGMCYSIFERMSPGHECCTGRGAGGADEETVEADAGVVKFVQIGGLDPGMSMAAYGAVSLIVSHDENDVGFFAECRIRCLSCYPSREECQDEKWKE